MPMECNYLALPVMPRVCHDTTLRRARGVIVRVIFLVRHSSFRVWSDCMVGPLRGGRGWAALTRLLRLILLNALTKLPFPFCLLYRAWRSLEERCDGVDCQAAEEAVAARDVLRFFFAFQDYCREEDILCLLNV
ncbi:hypothetical protein TcCL_NonESM10177 [Trypanosoma cruzi]|nr:hypothetical protein TcCL_NonESM10177 [Trypanosoma cruzi]